jgi:hypothetical protein
MFKIYDFSCHDKPVDVCPTMHDAFLNVELMVQVKCEQQLELMKKANDPAANHEQYQLLLEKASRRQFYIKTPSGSCLGPEDMEQYRLFRGLPS